MIRYTLKQLAYFAAAAERGNVTAAARALNVSQPSVSTAIAHLERVLGAQLFLRHHARGLSLTPDGRHLLAEARDVLARAEELGSALRSEGGRLKGELSLGYFVTFAPYYLPGLLRRFRALHPDVVLQLHEGDIETLQRGLASGGIELALVYDLALGPGSSRSTWRRTSPMRCCRRRIRSPNVPGCRCACSPRSRSCSWTCRTAASISARCFWPMASSRRCAMPRPRSRWSAAWWRTVTASGSSISSPRATAPMTGCRSPAGRSRRIVRRSGWRSPGRRKRGRAARPRR